LPPHLRLTYQGRLVDCSDSSNVHTESPSKATSLIKKDSMSKRWASHRRPPSAEGPFTGARVSLGGDVQQPSALVIAQRLNIDARAGCPSLLCMSSFSTTCNRPRSQCDDSSGPRRAEPAFVSGFSIARDGPEGARYRREGADVEPFDHGPEAVLPTSTSAKTSVRPKGPRA
jgi:hypothetical protein